MYARFLVTQCPDNDGMRPAVWDGNRKRIVWSIPAGEGAEAAAQAEADRRNAEVTPFYVEAGVKGASRISRWHFTTQEEAVRRAARWASSNSIGSYWAEVIKVDGAEVVKSFNL